MIAFEDSMVGAARPHVSGRRIRLAVGNDLGQPRAAPHNVADAAGRHLRLERTAAALMDAGDFHARSLLDLAERELHRAAHEPADRQRPVVGIDARHSEVAKHDRVLGARHAIDELVRLERMAAESAGRIKRCTGTGWTAFPRLHDDLASRWSRGTCKSPRSSDVPRGSRPRHPGRTGSGAEPLSNAGGRAVAQEPFPMPAAWLPLD